MIRLATLDPFDPGDLAFVARTLFQAYGVGAEHAGDRRLPREAKSDGSYDPVKLLEEADPVRTYADDKVLYLAAAPLSIPPGPLGAPPCYGFAQYGGTRAVVSTARIPARGVTEASVEAFRRRLARECVHFVGHLWDLHHCYDPRCAMHPSWSPGLGADPSYELDAFCREKSEQRIRLAKA